MRIGIVGSEAAKFTLETETQARAAIRNLIRPRDIVISGGCHLGGIDKWAVEEAEAQGIQTVEFKPLIHTWEGYKERNILIAQHSDAVACITVKELPSTYRGMTFPLCYHCGTAEHVKSGGCWTTKYAREKLGKPTKTIVI